MCSGTVGNVVSWGPVPSLKEAAAAQPQPLGARHNVANAEILKFQGVPDIQIVM